MKDNLSQDTKSKTITKKALVMDVSRKLKMHPTEVKLVVQSVLNVITENLASGNRFELRDFGVFEVVTRKAKIGRNPKAPGKDIQIPDRSAVKFSPGKKMKSLVKSE